MSHNLQVALKWAEAGAHIFVTDGDKRARVKWRDSSTTDPAIISAWFDRWPDSLPAIDLAKSSVVVVDGDRHGGPDGVAAAEQIFADRQLTAAAIPTVVTPQKGRHYWFRQPTDGAPLGNRDKAVRDSGINVRGHGGYVIAPGARLSDGRSYQRDPDTPSTIEALSSGTIPILPPALVALLRPNGHDKTFTNGNARKTGTREEAYAQAALSNISSELAGIAPGGRNNELNIAALKMGCMVAVGWISRATVEGELFNAAQACGLVADDGQHSVRSTIKSGLDAGLRDPHAPLVDRPSPSATDK
jgi:Bifunctional DNA primase/polymerase, N-terminal